MADSGHARACIKSAPWGGAGAKKVFMSMSPDGPRLGTRIQRKGITIPCFCPCFVPASRESPNPGYPYLFRKFFFPSPLFPWSILGLGEFSALRSGSLAHGLTAFASEMTRDFPCYGLGSPTRVDTPRGHNPTCCSYLFRPVQTSAWHVARVKQLITRWMNDWKDE